MSYWTQVFQAKNLVSPPTHCHFVNHGQEEQKKVSCTCVTTLVEHTKGSDLLTSLML